MKPDKRKNLLRRIQTAKQKISFRQVFLFSIASVALIFGLIFILHFSSEKKAIAGGKTATETLSSGSFIVNMGITPQTYANGMKPYGMVYDLVINYQVPVKWVIEPTKSKDGTDFTYSGTSYKGGPFIIPKEYITSTVSARITYWQGLGVQGVYTTSSISVPVYMTITSYPNILIDTLSSNQTIAAAYFTNAGIPSSAYSYGKPASLTTCHDLWVNPHGDPRWADYSYLYNFITVQHSWIWCECHAASVMEGCYNYSPPNQQLNYLTTNGLKCWKGGGGFNCDNLITESHATASTSPYTYNYSSDPVMQFMASMANPTMGGSEQWYQPQSTGTWRTNTKRLVTTATGTSPNEGVLLVYGPGYGNTSNGYVMYNAGHDNNATGGSTADWVAAQRSFLNYAFLAGAAKAPLFSSCTIPSSFKGGDTINVSVTVTSGSPTYNYQWTSTIPGTFANANVASTTFTASNSDSSFTGVIRCIVTDACSRKNFVAQIISLSQTPLPITLVSFDAKPVGNAIKLTWATANEINNDFFTIERSDDGRNFFPLFKVNGAGNSTSMLHYEAKDEKPLSGINYYRLKQTDYDGKFAYSEVKIVKFDKTKMNEPLTIQSIWPNPFTKSFGLTYASETGGAIDVIMMSITGSIIKKETLQAEKGLNSFQFINDIDIQPGIYYVTVSKDGKAVTKKIIKS